MVYCEAVRSAILATAWLLVELIAIGYYDYDYDDNYYCVALRVGRIKCCIPSVCPSIPCLRFSRNRKAVKLLI